MAVGSIAPNITPGEVEPDFVQSLREHPWYDERFYGPDGQGPITAALDEIDVPFLAVVSQNVMLHAGWIRGVPGVPSPAASDSSSCHSHYYPFFYEFCLDDQVAFFDRWLKDDEDACSWTGRELPLRHPHRSWTVHLALTPPPGRHLERSYSSASRCLDRRCPTRASER